MPRKSSRNNQSRASSSQRSPPLSQTRIEQHLASSQVSIDDQVNNVVRYFVNNAGQNVYFRRADVQKHCVPKAGQQFQQVIEKATRILRDVYGYNVLVVDQAANSSKAYVVSNALPYKNYSVDRNETQPKDVKKILLLLILSHIYMSNFPTPEASLHSFLKYFKIDVNVKHPLFGQVKEYIMNVLVKQKFLLVETDPLTKKVGFSWGVRAEKEISKHEILKFVCKMFNDRQPKSWTNQYRVACEQGFENERNIETNGIDENEE